MWQHKGEGSRSVGSVEGTARHGAEGQPTSLVRPSTGGMKTQQSTGSVGGGRSADGHALDSIVVEDRGVRLAQEVEEHEDAPQHKCERERSTAAPFRCDSTLEEHRSGPRMHAHTRARGAAPVRAWPRACSVRRVEQMHVASLCAFEADGNGARARVCARASVCGRTRVCARTCYICAQADAPIAL